MDTQTLSIHIRPTTAADIAAIDALLRAAFGPEQGAEIAELVFALLDDPSAQPCLSLAATAGPQILGYILFTRVTFTPDAPEISATILAPLAVDPTVQARGIGAQLIAEGRAQLLANGCDLIFVLGDPRYYTRHGFAPAGCQGLDAPYPIAPAHADAWMVQALRPNILGRIRGQLCCATALNDPKHWHE